MEDKPPDGFVPANLYPSDEQIFPDEFGEYGREEAADLLDWLVYHTVALKIIADTQEE